MNNITKVKMSESARMRFSQQLKDSTKSAAMKWLYLALGMSITAAAFIVLAFVGGL